MSMTLEQDIRILHPETYPPDRAATIQDYIEANGLKFQAERACKHDATILACEVMQREVERGKGCEYCDFSRGDVGATMNNCGDNFILIKSRSRKGAAIATDEKHYYILDVNFCPNCGKPMNDGKVDGDE